VYFLCKRSNLKTALKDKDVLRSHNLLLATRKLEAKKTNAGRGQRPALPCAIPTGSGQKIRATTL
jgi:hypothetical protein